MRTSVLVVDDDRQQVQWLHQILTSQGYVVLTAQDGESALSRLRGWAPALVVTDLAMSRMNGIELCRLLRRTSDIPVVVLSDNDDAASEVAALDAGADDYIVKPFATERFLARVRGAVRRGAHGEQPSAMGVGAFHIDFNDRRVQVHGQKVRLTPKEFDLFVFMASHPNKVLRHKTLLGAVWGQASEDQSEYLRVFMRQLRKKLESNPSRPQYLVTEPWVGYRFNPAGPTQ